MTANFEHRIEIVPPEILPKAQVIQPVEAPGALIWYVRRGEMTPELCDNVNFYLRFWVRQGQSAQTWETPTSTTEPDTASRKIGWVRITFVESGELPGDVLVEPVEEEGGFVWHILRGEMSERLAREVERHLEEYLKLGALVQRGAPRISDSVSE